MSSRSKRAIVAEEEEYEERQGGLIHAVINLALKPVRPFISRSARQAYLATFLLISTAIVLFGGAVIAYALFYYSYIPRIGFERTIHLQFDHVYAPATIARHAHPFPYGSVALGPDLVGQQAYDVKIVLTMPRTPENTEAGNFMLEANMYAAGYDSRPSGSSGGIAGALQSDISALSAADNERKALLATSRRPAILPYRSRIVDILYKATELHWYLLGLRSESVTLTVPIYEKVAFGRGRANIPATLRLELQSASRLQVYSAKVHFRARFRGLRWLMYNHRIFSAIVFIGIFWTTEILFAGIAWAVLAVHLAKQKEEAQIKAEGGRGESSSDRRIKSEEEDDEASDPARLAPMSDTERTYPTLSGQSPLRYTSASEGSGAAIIKREEDDGVPVAMIPEALGSRATEADDEDDDEDMDFFDSGIGTSLESSGPARSDSMRRRRSRQAGGRSGKEGF